MIMALSSVLMTGLAVTITASIPLLAILIGIGVAWPLAC